MRGAPAPSLGEPRSDLNVTPLVDVVLVLLIIFMAAVPLISRRYDVQFPVPPSRPPLPPTASPLLVEIQTSGALRVNGREVARGRLSGELRRLLDQGMVAAVLLDAADSLRYGDVVEVLDSIRKSGAAKIGVMLGTTPAPGEP